MYCQLFIMTECIVSLKLGERFEEKDGVNWELVCADDTKRKNASDSIATEKGFLLSFSNPRNRYLLYRFPNIKSMR